MTNEIKIRYLITAPKGAFRDIDEAGGSKFVYCTITQIEKEMTIISHRVISVLARDLYIGEYDRYGKEIYENDIVKESWGRNSRILKVEDRGFDLKLSVMESGGTIEVIGNIYENPTLLEGNKK